MTDSVKTILVVEDNPDDRVLIKKFLSFGTFKSWTVEFSTRLSEAIAFIDSHTPDIMLLDLSLPDSSGIESYSRLKRKNGLIPIIVLTGMADLNLAQQLIHKGAQDYLMKGDFDIALLEKAIYYAIERNKLKIENDTTKELLLDSVLEAQDMERSRIAKELHDGVVQSLTAVSLNLGLLRRSVSQFDQKTQYHYEKCTDNLSNTIDEIRNISHSLMPRTIADLTLIDALDALVTDLSAVTEMEIDFFSNLKMNLDEKRKISIYRIVQELMNNALKHSQASKMIIQLLEYPDHVSLMVEDDGVGFDLNLIKGAKGCFGLQSLESRVSVIGGSLEIDAKPNKGTNVSIFFPKSTN